MTFLVWPQVIPAMKYADFPEIRNTHIESTSASPRPIPIAERAATSSRASPRQASPTASDRPLPQLRNRARQARPDREPEDDSRPATVDCTFASGAVIDIVEGPGRSERSSSTTGIGHCERTRRGRQPHPHHPWRELQSVAAPNALTAPCVDQHKAQRPHTRGKLGRGTRRVPLPRASPAVVWFA